MSRSSAGQPPQREAVIQSAVVAVLNRPGSPCRVWRNNVGSLPSPDGRGRITYGLAKGSADLIGIIVPTGRFLSIEMKTPVGRLTPEQKAWAVAIRKLGGEALVIRSVEEAEELVARLGKLRPCSCVGESNGISGS